MFVPGVFAVVPSVCEGRIYPPLFSVSAVHSLRRGNLSFNCAFTYADNLRQSDATCDDAMSDHLMDVSEVVRAS